MFGSYLFYIISQWLFTINSSIQKSTISFTLWGLGNVFLLHKAVTQCDFCSKRVHCCLRQNKATEVFSNTDMSLSEGGM
jgi:hypothetical protein